MIDLSTVTEPQIVKVDENTAIRYRVVKEQIDLEALRVQKKRLELQLKTSKPSDDELIEMAKNSHPYYQIDRGGIKKQIDEIDSLLKE